MKEDMLLMNAKERQRKALLEAVKNKQMTLVAASERMQLSVRQARRILRGYEQRGDKSLMHRSRGKRSNHAQNPKLKTLVLELYRTRYAGFGPTFAAEKLQEEGHPVIPETLRLWLKENGLWDEKRKRIVYRKQRKRKARFGEMLQLDGSFHLWFGNDLPMTCLMNLVDDATGTTLALMAEQETTEAAMTLLWQWIERYGVPQAIYVDLKTVYVSPKSWKINPDDNPEASLSAFTHFSNACKKLGIKIIRAHSPQAKGRVERKHAVFQDRFVKELYLKNIKTLEKANTFLQSTFLPGLNLKFAKPAEDLQNGHRPLAPIEDLNQIFCWDEERQVQNDWTVRFEGKHYQLLKTKGVRAKQKIVVREHLDGALSLWRENQRLGYEEIPLKITLPREKRGYDAVQKSRIAKKNKHKSPWNQFTPGWLQYSKKMDYRPNTVL